MSRYRITVEWGIGVIKQKWKLLKTKVNFFPEIGSHVFITSIAKCMYRLSMYLKQLDAFAPAQKIPPLLIRGRVDQKNPCV